MATVIDTPELINEARARILRSALRLYVNTGIKANSGYTPTRMLASAGSITGKTYKRGKNGMNSAIADLTSVLGD